MLRRVSFGLALTTGLFVLVLGVAGLEGKSLDVTIRQILPMGGGLAFGLDRLSAFFLLLIAVGVLPAALYGIGYTRHYEAGQLGMALALNIFIPSMALVVL